LGPGIGKPLEIAMSGDAGKVKWIDIKKERPVKFTPSIGDWVWTYHDSTTFFVKGVVEDGVTGSIDGNLHVNGLICHTSCLPFSKDVSYKINASEKSTVAPYFRNQPYLRSLLNDATETMTLTQRDLAQKSPLFSGIDMGGLNTTTQSVEKPVDWDYSPQEQKIKFNLWLAILLGFIAGIILNAMPCVLPVLGIKILSFSQAQESSRKEAILKSLVFSAGMISVFMILAALASFANFSWGEQFQNPKVLVGIIAFIFVFALGMFDVFMILVPGSISSLEQKAGSGLMGDFFKGVFATVLATPCSGPLLGATLAWTLMQPSPVIFAVFASIGAGMAFPYILFSASKRLSRLIPKPGVWMKDFKYLMGFILLGMVVYLMIGLPQNMIISTLGLCLVLAFAVMLYTRYAPWGSTWGRKIIVGLITAGIIFAGVYGMFGILYNRIAGVSSSSVEGTEVWSDFSPELLREAHANGQNVIIDFTANWCMNCQYNKVAVLHTPQLEKAIKDKNVLSLKADLTRPDPQIEALMQHLGSRSVPFLAVFPGDKPYEPIVMRDIVNKKELLKVMGKLK
jgi:thiol:disulfide interchange protein